MSRGYYILMMISLLVFGCANNKKSNGNSTDSVSIYKLWKFDTVHSVSNEVGSGWIGRNILDLTKHDTLRFSYKSNKAKATSYAYKILHDTIFVNNSAAYKVLKLTGDELDLYAIFNGKKSSGKDSVVMIYKAK